MRLLLFLALCLSHPLSVSAQAQDADALMRQFAAVWTADDTDALRQLMADDVVVYDNGDVLLGADAVANAWGRSMADTGRMTIYREESGSGGDVAYQQGGWALEVGEDEVLGTHHFTFRRARDGDYHLVVAHVQNNAAPAPTRAAEGETVAVMLTPVKADKREQFEAYIRDFQATLAENIAAGRARPGDFEAYTQTRFLTPTEANEDGTYTYVILADPDAAEADYSMLDALELRYPVDEAERQYALFEDALAGPQQVIVLQQSEW